jgi:hypothetical protein
MDKILSGLYYPFSRPIEIASLKQMLLVFENVVFLDPIDDEYWRAKLFQELETQEDKRFAKYQQVHEELTMLFQAGAARRVDPAQVTALESPLTTAAALSDLFDQEWSNIALTLRRSACHTDDLDQWEKHPGKSFYRKCQCRSSMLFKRRRSFGSILFAQVTSTHRGHSHMKRDRLYP